MRLKSSDGEEFVVDEEVMKEMETLKRMTKFGDNDDDEVPTCAIKGRSLEKVLVWIKYQDYFEKMDLKETFDTIISADYLENERLSKAMLKKLFFNNKEKDVDEAANQYEDATIVRLLEDFKRRKEVVVSLNCNELKYFDPNTSQKITIAKIPNGVSSQKVCAVKDRIYVIGENGDTEKTNVAEYNALTKGWKILPGASFDPIRKRPNDENHFSVDFVHGIGNKLYISWSDSLYGEGEICELDLDKKNPRWMTVASPNNEHFEYECARPGVAVTDDAIYMVGGEVETSIEKYDVEQNKWTVLTNLSSARGDTGVAVLDGKIYVSGGTDKTSKNLKKVECYDSATGTWANVASMNRGRSGHDLLVMNGSLVALGGDRRVEGGVRTRPTVEEYNVTDDTWTLREKKLDKDHRGAFLMMKYYLDQ